MIRAVSRSVAFETGRLDGLYVRFCNPSGDEYASYLRAPPTFHAQGESCYIMPSATSTDPVYVEIGKTCRWRHAQCSVTMDRSQSCTEHMGGSWTASGPCA